MNSDQIRTELGRLGLTQTRAAKLLEMSDRQMRAYCAGRAKVPRVVQLALRGLEAEGLR